MNILYLNTFKPWGGDELWTVNSAYGLIKRGHKVSIACPRDAGLVSYAKDQGIPLFYYSIGPDIAFWKVPSMIRYLKRSKIDVIICVQTRDIKIGGLAARIAGVPVILARQGLGMLRRNLYHKLAFTRFMDGIITNTKSIKDLYMTYGWFDEGFIHVVYDGAPIREKAAVYDFVKELGFPNDCMVIAAAGRISRQKGFDVLVQVARLAKDRHLNWRFVVAGSGKEEDALKNLSKELMVEDLMHFIGFQEDVLSIMKAADLFVLSSRSEGMPNVLREAMMVGKACVATNVNGVSELVEHGKSGWLVDHADPDLLFEGIRHVMSDDQLRIELGQAAYERVRNHFSLQKMIDEQESLYQHLLKKALSTA